MGAGFIVLTGAMIRAGAAIGGGDPHSNTRLPLVLWLLFAVGSAVIVIQVLSWFIRFKAIDLHTHEFKDARRSIFLAVPVWLGMVGGTLVVRSLYLR